MNYANIREEELKNRVATDFFGKFDCDPIIGSIDFAVKLKKSQKTADDPDVYFVWAEAKNKPADAVEMLAQLVLTIGKARTFTQKMPPAFLACFDCEKIAFVPYDEFRGIFSQTDFNWNVAPSNHDTREFRHIKDMLEKLPPGAVFQFHFRRDKNELKQFVAENFVQGNIGVNKIQIDKNNFTFVYYKWLDAVKSSIDFDWIEEKGFGVYDGHFYLADLLSDQNMTLGEKLSVLLKNNKYEISKKFPNYKHPLFAHISFKDDQKAHKRFWAVYERPPLREYWDFIIERQDLLVPQDVRERKGAFFTPRQWVELSQKYIADALGKNWQDEYVVWDCCAGTGNLLVGLNNKNNIWASTLDKADVDVMLERIEHGANLWPNQVFQFDFLNDEFVPKSKGGKIPDALFNILNDAKKRRKLVIYINPPYAEATNAKTPHGTGENKAGVANTHKTAERYKHLLGKATNEIFVQFLIRIHVELQRCKIANFAKLKALCAFNFAGFREAFQARLEKLFVVPGNTFDNVKGDFPIGFHVWDTGIKSKFQTIDADVFSENGLALPPKRIYSNDTDLSINKWIKLFAGDTNDCIGFLPSPAPDFQNNNYLFITMDMGTRHVYYLPITQGNLFKAAVYFAARKAISATWLNDRDQFLYPNDTLETDMEFQRNCLAYTLFHDSNNIQSQYGVNHWIPFTEAEVGSRERFASSFMTDFMAGKITPEKSNEWFVREEPARYGEPCFSAEARAVFDAGRALWRYYHQQPKANPNASWYDIRQHFKGQTEKGGKTRMNAKSMDAEFNKHYSSLRAAMSALAQKIEPKVYEHGFLKQ